MSCFEPSPTLVAQQLLNEYAEAASLIRMRGDSINTGAWRSALRHAGVPVLELNDAPEQRAAPWMAEARAYSTEFVSPVVVLGRGSGFEGIPLDGSSVPWCSHRQVNDADWVQIRQIALTRGVENSSLNREFRRESSRKGWIRVGWHEDIALAEGNGLLLAWSSPLPLMRIRNFAARCPQITLIAPDPEALAEDVAAQGITVSGWRFEVK